MKKVFAIALAIIMTLSVVVGCSGKKETPPAKSTAIAQQQQKENGKAGSSAEKNKQNKKTTSSRNKPLPKQMTRLTAQQHPGPK